MESRSVFLHEFVTGGGLTGEELPASWAAEGRAMRHALAEDFSALEGVSVVMTLDARLPDEPGPWRTIRVGPGCEPSVFTSLAATSDFTLLVAPETRGILEDRARILEQVGGRSLGCRHQAIALCADKLRLATHLREVGIETPRSIRVVPAEGLPRDFPYPAVLKPIDGAGSIDTFYVESPDHLPDDAQAMPEALLQPFVVGQPMSASFLIFPDEAPRLVGLAEQHIEQVAGRFSYRGGCTRRGLDDTHRLVETLREMVRNVPGLRGWVGVDFVWDASSGRATVLEINPRPTTSYVGFREMTALRHDLAGCWFSRHDFGRIRPDLSVQFTADGAIRREVSVR